MDATHTSPQAIAPRTLVLRGGRRVTLRGVTPSDAEGEQAFVRRLSARSRLFRFHGAVNELRGAMLDYLTRVDQHRHVGIVAVIEVGGEERVVGDARYVLGEDGETGEFAIAVDDAMQRCGLGRCLVDALLAAANSRGVRWLVGSVMAGNEAMLAMVRALGFHVSSAVVEGVVAVERRVAPLATPRRGVAAWLAALWTREASPHAA